MAASVVPGDTRNVQGEVKIFLDRSRQQTSVFICHMGEETGPVL